MFRIPKKEVESLKQTYPIGATVELARMDDPFSKLVPGDRGVVRCVDDIGTIHVNWENGSSLGIAYGQDECKLIWDGRERLVQLKSGNYVYLYSSDNPPLNQEATGNVGYYIYDHDGHMEDGGEIDILDDDDCKTLLDYLPEIFFEDVSIQKQFRVNEIVNSEYLFDEDNEFVELQED